LKLRVLGCSGGIGGRHLRTTSMLVDKDVLVDAGSGVGDLTLAELMAIDRVFLTHSHLDHVLGVPLMVDSVGHMRTTPITVHALPATIEILKNHVFNWSIWPDFAQIPTNDRPFMTYAPIRVGESVDLGGGRRITALPANHVVPAIGYQLDSGRASLVFTGDTTANDALWAVANKIENLRHLIIECAFNNRERELAVLSKHLCPSMLAEELAKLERSAEIYVTHLKPGEIELTMQEIEDCAGAFRPRMLQNSQVIEF
jgi:ribonuclease BN (tRNA processing enzyme)